MAIDFSLITYPSNPRRVDPVLLEALIASVRTHTVPALHRHYATGDAAFLSDLNTVLLGDPDAGVFFPSHRETFLFAANAGLMPEKLRRDKTTPYFFHETLGSVMLSLLVPSHYKDREEAGHRILTHDNLEEGFEYDQEVWERHFGSLDRMPRSAFDAAIIQCAPKTRKYIMPEKLVKLYQVATFGNRADAYVLLADALANQWDNDYYLNEFESLLHSPSSRTDPLIRAGYEERRRDRIAIHSLGRPLVCADILKDKIPRKVHARFLAIVDAAIELYHGRFGVDPSFVKSSRQDDVATYMQSSDRCRELCMTHLQTFGYSFPNKP